MNSVSLTIASPLLKHSQTILSSVGDDLFASLEYHLEQVKSYLAKEDLFP